MSILFIHIIFFLLTLIVSGGKYSRIVWGGGGVRFVLMTFLVFLLLKSKETNVMPTHVIYCNMRRTGV